MLKVSWWKSGVALYWSRRDLGDAIDGIVKVFDFGFFLSNINQGLEVRIVERSFNFFKAIWQSQFFFSTIEKFWDSVCMIWFEIGVQFRLY